MIYNKLPKSWCVKMDYSKDFKDFVLGYLNKIDRENTYLGIGNEYYYGIDKNNNITFDRDKSVFDVELTLDEFKQLVQIDNRKIIGYKVPYDIYGGLIKKGFTYTNWGCYSTYTPKEAGGGKIKPHNAVYFQLPYEIVKDWEPVYEETQFYYDILLDDNKFTTLKVKVEELYFIYDNEKISVNHMKTIVNNIVNNNCNLNNYSVETTHISIGCKKMIPINRLIDLLEFHKKHFGI